MVAARGRRAGNHFENHCSNKYDKRLEAPMSLLYVSICVGLLALVVAIGGPLLLVIIALLVIEVSAVLRVKVSMFGRDSSTRTDQSTAHAVKDHRFDNDLPYPDSSSPRRSGRIGRLLVHPDKQNPEGARPSGFC
jgi:hypothetical protein